MRIAYLIAQGDFYGSERHFLDLVGFMNKTCHIKCILLSGGALEVKLQDEGVDYVVINDRSWILKIKSILLIFNAIKKFGPHILHAHQPRATLWGMIFARILGIAGISTIHSNPESHAKNYVGLKSILVLLFHRFVRLLVSILAEKTVYVSKDAQRRSTINRNSTVIYNWLPKAFGEQKCTNKFSGQLKRYVCVCSVVRSKGIYELLDFFSKILIKNPCATLDIAGGGLESDIENFMEYVRERGMELQVSLLGYQPDISALLEKYHAFVCLTHDETFGLVFIEAMAKGLPIIASDIPILREIVHPCNYFVDLTTLQCDRFDDLVCLTDFSELANANIEWVFERFSYQRQMGKTMRLYEEMAKNLHGQYDA